MSLKFYWQITFYILRRRIKVLKWFDTQLEPARTAFCFILQQTCQNLCSLSSFLSHIVKVQVLFKKWELFHSTPIGIVEHLHCVRNYVIVKISVRWDVFKMKRNIYSNLLKIFFFWRWVHCIGFILPGTGIKNLIWHIAEWNPFLIIKEPLIYFAGIIHRVTAEKTTSAALGYIFALTN